MTVSKTGKTAVTNYVVEERGKNYSILRLLLETGRTHQIRVHLSYIGHPILGDTLYGSNIMEKRYCKDNGFYVTSGRKFFQRRCKNTY